MSPKYHKEATGTIKCDRIFHWLGTELKTVNKSPRISQGDQHCEASVSCDAHTRTSSLYLYTTHTLFLLNTCTTEDTHTDTHTHRLLHTTFFASTVSVFFCCQQDAGRP